MFSGPLMALLWDTSWRQSEVIVPNVRPRVIKPKVICFHYFDSLVQIMLTFRCFILKLPPLTLWTHSILGEFHLYVADVQLGRYNDFECQVSPDQSNQHEPLRAAASLDVLGKHKIILSTYVNRCIFSTTSLCGLDNGKSYS